jgi:hypothetical protein
VSESLRASARAYGRLFLLTLSTGVGDPVGEDFSITMWYVVE